MISTQALLNWGQKDNQRRWGIPGGDHHTVVKNRSSHTRQTGIVLTKAARGGRHTVNRRGLSSPSWQVVLTQSTNEYAITQSARKGCHHQAGKMSSDSQLKEWGHHVNPWAGIPYQPKSGDTKSTQGVGTPSQLKEKGHQVNPGSGETKWTQGDRGHQFDPRAGTPNQPKRGRGHQVTHRRRGHHVTHRRRGHHINPQRKRGDA